MIKLSIWPDGERVVYVAPRAILAIEPTDYGCDVEVEGRGNYMVLMPAEELLALRAEPSKPTHVINVGEGTDVKALIRELRKELGGGPTLRPFA